MDHREALPAGAVLAFPGMPCTLEEEIGRGSNAIVYKGSYPDLLNVEERHTVLIKELFPFHQKAAILRSGEGRIICKEEGQETLDLHRRSFEYGNRIHLRLLEKHPEITGANINTFSLHGTMYSVLGYNGGRSLENESAGEAPALRQLALRLLGLLDGLEAFHESGFLHLDIAPDNILLVGRGDKERVMLIDYNSVYEQDTLQDGLVYYSTKAGYSAPEIHMGRRPTPAADLYSATAVFYRCLTGVALTPFQISRPAPPDVSGCTALQDQPDTVTDMVQQILRRGLQNLPRKRYQSVAQMREAVQELLDRIDGVGVTHWALWESGRRMVNRAVRENHALAFLRQEEELFLTRVLTDDYTVMPVSTWLSGLSSAGSHTALLTAPGGMGKTTAMLRAVMERTYSPDQPAMIYLSLYGWKEGESAYIHNRILEHLRFKPEQRSFADARHALDQLIDQPLHTPQGERPMLLLLLDGLNEASGATQPLVEEILDLSRKPGVGLLVSTRGGESVLPFPTVSIIPLEEGEVEERLSQHGLLAPESPGLRELLRTPLMLSIFLQSAQAEQRQMSVQTREELIGAYLSALLAKEIRALPENAEARWQLEAAVSLVLPAIAGELQKRGRSLADAELLPTVERCYCLFSARLLRRAFPQWIGHSQAIRGNAANSEEWFGRIVHDILWKRMGLLVRNDQGNYQSSHQIIAEYLATIDRENQRRIWRRRRVKLTLIAVVCLLTLAAGWEVYTRCFDLPYEHPYADLPPYEWPHFEWPLCDENLAVEVLTYGMNGYVNAGHQYGELRELLDCAMEMPEDYAKQLELYHDPSRYGSENHINDGANDALDQLVASGRIPWSCMSMDEGACRELIALAQSREMEYAEFVAVLTWMVEGGNAEETYNVENRKEYIEKLSELVDIDAYIAATLYQIACKTHFVGKLDFESPWVHDYNTKVSTVIEQNKRLADLGEQSDLSYWKDILGSLRGLRAKTLSELQATSAIADYRKELSERP